MPRERIDEIYRQLGMLQQDTGMSSNISSGLQTGPLSSGLTNAFDRTGTTQPAPFFQEMQTTDPQALDSRGMLYQFWAGTGSPVVDTARALGITDTKFDQPTNIRETFANLAGTLLGWSTVLMLPGIGKGISAAGGGIAAGLKGIGVGHKLATSMGKSMTVGGTLGAHRAWVQEKPLGKEVLQGMAFAGTLATAGHGIGMLARKTGRIVDTASVLKQHQNILTVTDETSMLTALGKLPQKKVQEGVNRTLQNIKSHAKHYPSKLDPMDVGAKYGVDFNKLKPNQQAVELIRAFNTPGTDSLLQPLMDITSTQATAAKIMSSKFSGAMGNVRTIVEKAEPVKLKVDQSLMKSLTKKQQENMVKLYEAKTLGEQFDIFRSIKASTQATKNTVFRKHGVQSLPELAKKAPQQAQKYVEREAMTQDLTWALSERIYKTATVHPSVPLPHLKSVPNLQAAETVLKDLKNMVDKGMDLTSNITWHPKIKQVIDTWSAKTGKTYTNTAFMPKKMAEEFKNAIKEVKAAGDSPRTFTYGLAHFNLPATVPVTIKGKTVDSFAFGDVPAWIKGLEKLPKGATFLPTNMHDALMLKRDITPLLSRIMTPVRHALGEPFANSARLRIQAKDKFLDHYLVKMKGWDTSLNLKGRAKSDAYVRINKALEAKIPEENIRPLMLQMRNFANMESLEGLSQKGLQSLARKSGVTVKQLQDIHGKIRRVMGDEKFLETVKNIPEKYGTWQEHLAVQHMLGHKLKNSVKLTAKGKEQLAKTLGLNNTKELDIARNMRLEFDKLFHKAQLDPDRYIAAYAPRFRQMHEKSFREIAKELKDMGATERERAGYMWINDMTREGGNFNYSENALANFKRYVTGYAKEYYFDDLFKTWNKHFKQMKLPNQKAQLYEDLKAYMVGKPSHVEQQFDALIYRMGDSIMKSGWKDVWGHRPTQELSSMLAELQYLGGLGFNPFTAFKNLTQKGLAFSNITEDGNPFRGVYWMARAQMFKRTTEGKYITGYNKVLQSRQYQEGLQAQEGAITQFLRKMNAPEFIQKGSEKFRQRAFDMFRISDRSNVEDTFLAKYLYLTSKGAPIADAANLATQTTMATQFMYGFDSPMLYKSPFGKQLGIFMSWPINWARLLYNQGTAGEAKQAIATVGTMAVGAHVMNLTRMNFNSIHPANTARSILPIAMLEGERRMPIALRFAGSLNAQIRALVRGDADAIDLAFDELKNSMAPLIPAGVMGQRALNFIDVAKNDWKKYDSRGRLMYEADKGQAIRQFFGPTIEAHERQQDWQQIQRMESAYRHMRAMAIDSFIDEDYEEFERLQEQLVFNFGRYIEPQDIQYELRMRDMTSLQRQLIGVPQSLSHPFLERRGYEIDDDEAI